MQIPLRRLRIVPSAQLLENAARLPVPGRTAV